MRLPARWTPHKVLVKPFVGTGGAGPIYGEQYALDPAAGKGCYVEDVREVVVDDEGSEVVSNTKVICNFDDAPPEQSLITVWPGTAFQREAPAVRVSRYEHPEFPGFAEVRLK